MTLFLKVLEQDIVNSESELKDKLIKETVNFQNLLKDLYTKDFDKLVTAPIFWVKSFIVDALLNKSRIIYNY